MVFVFSEFRDKGKMPHLGVKGPTLLESRVKCT